MVESFSNSFTPPSKATSILSVLGGSSIISLAPFFVEYSGLDATTSGFYRMLIGAIAFSSIALFKKEPFLKLSQPWLCFLSGLMLALDLVVWNKSVLYVGAGLSTILANLEIVFLVLIGFFFYKERLPPLFFRLCGLISLGIYFLIYPYLKHIQLENFLGITFGLGASLIYSIYLCLLKAVGNKNSKLSMIVSLAQICFFGTLVLGFFMIVSRSNFIIPDKQALCCIIFNGLLSQVVGWWLITHGIRQLSLALAGLLLLTQPVLTFVFDCLFLNRNTSVLQLGGCALLLTAVYFTILGEKKRELGIT